jgi:predicted nucleic acid-binding protein
MIAEALSPVQSIEILVEMTNRDDHVFWPCDIPFTRDSIPCDCLVGYRQVTDAYLLGLAIHHQGKFVTFDRAIASLVSRSDARRDSIEIIGV